MLNGFGSAARAPSIRAVFRKCPSNAPEVAITGSEGCDFRSIMMVTCPVFCTSSTESITPGAGRASRLEGEFAAGPRSRGYNHYHLSGG